jgi:hypothetical protein
LVVSCEISHWDGDGWIEERGTKLLRPMVVRARCLEREETQGQVLIFKKRKWLF